MFTTEFNVLLGVRPGRSTLGPAQALTDVHDIHAVSSLTFRTALDGEMSMYALRSESLLRGPSFRGLFLTQLLGAFNDNLFKIVVSLLALDTAAVGHSGGYLSVAGAVFMTPYLMFSGYAGYAADVFDKRRVLILVKAFEIVIMALAFAALASGRIALLLSVLFLLGAQATFFSPAKYGIVPEMLPEALWPRANGFLEFGRYAAVILGTALCGL